MNYRSIKMYSSIHNIPGIFYYKFGDNHFVWEWLFVFVENAPHGFIKLFLIYLVYILGLLKRFELFRVGYYLKFTLFDCTSYKKLPKPDNFLVKIPISFVVVKIFFLKFSYESVIHETILTVFHHVTAHCCAVFVK